MSLINLSRSTPQAKPCSNSPISADDFILQAVHYAQGGSNSGVVAHLPDTEDNHSSPMRRATFTLTEECIAMLSELSQQCEIPKSKLIRIWIKHFAQIDNE